MPLQASWQVDLHRHMDTHLWSFVQWILFLLPLPPLTGHPEPLFLSQPIPKGPHSGPPFPSLTPLPSPEPWDTHGLSQGSGFPQPSDPVWVNTFSLPSSGTKTQACSKLALLPVQPPSTPHPVLDQKSCRRPGRLLQPYPGAISGAQLPNRVLSCSGELVHVSARGPAPTGSTVSSHTPPPARPWPQFQHL